MTQRYHEMFRFWKRMIEFRRTHSTLRRRFFFNGAVNERGLADVAWHGCTLNQPGWSDPDARALGMTLGGFDGDADIHVMLNMYWKSSNLRSHRRPVGVGSRRSTRLRPRPTTSRIQGMRWSSLVMSARCRGGASSCWSRGNVQIWLLTWHAHATSGKANNEQIQRQSRR